MSVVLWCLFKRKTTYEMRISDWSSDVCSSDLCLRSKESFRRIDRRCLSKTGERFLDAGIDRGGEQRSSHGGARLTIRYYETDRLAVDRVDDVDGDDVRLLAEHMKEAVRHDTSPTTLSHMRADPEKRVADDRRRSEEHTSELQSLMRNSYADFCLKK